eukprot:TRINITY_DN11405_c1_g1_i1.p1 TRINITY_DN11405_c1_g1~~TRINITY_DN11405_c1_g1_i1.p1  ORF type:complete len:209 (-),score=25.91 TRINITY_DN11405_c1_g1_i1:188-814(-)
MSATQGNELKEPAPGDVCPKRFGLNFDPPSIVLEYLEVSTGKLFHRRVGLRRLRPTSDPLRVAEKLRQKNRALLAEDAVTLDQIVSLVKRLQESLSEKASSGTFATRSVNGAKEPDKLDSVGESKTVETKDKDNDENKPKDDGFDYSQENLNKLSQEELDMHKARMDVVFLKNQIKPGEPGFVYDVQVDFPEPEESGWDSEDDWENST